MRDGMKPVKILGVETDVEHYLVSTDGTIRHNVLLHLDEESVGRIRAGYVCIHCYEPQAEAFPEQCAICRFPMRDKQSEWFAREFRGTTRIGPSTSLEEEAAIMQEWWERKIVSERDEITRPSQILLPGRDF